MAAASYEQQILEQLRNMNDEQQRQVLEFTRTLKRPKGISGKEAIRIAAAINFPKEDLEEMSAAIEEWCERVSDFSKVNFDE